MPILAPDTACLAQSGTGEGAQGGRGGEGEIILPLANVMNNARLIYRIVMLLLGRLY